METGHKKYIKEVRENKEAGNSKWEVRNQKQEVRNKK